MKHELELELIQSHIAQKLVLRGEVGCACVAREVSVERGGMGERGCTRRLGGWMWHGLKCSHSFPTVRLGNTKVAHLMYLNRCENRRISRSNHAFFPQGPSSNRGNKCTLFRACCFLCACLHYSALIRSNRAYILLPE